MANETDLHDVLIQMAALQANMSSVLTAVDEIKSSVKEVVTLDRTIAELSIYNRQQAKEIQTQWQKIDHNQQAIESVEKKTDEWINKGRGAWFTLMILGGIAQVAVLSCVAYTFNHLRTAEDAILLLNQRVIQVEKR